MPTLTLTDLAPGRTATLQLYVRDTNTTVGSLITGTSVANVIHADDGIPAPVGLHYGRQDDGSHSRCN